MTLKVKVIVGFRGEQHHTIDADEAHKAYYLFEHPTERGIFGNGVAIRGQDIQTIVPDYQASMGWNSTHELDSDDHNELNKSGVSGKLQKLMAAAKEIAVLGDPQDMNIPLGELLKNKYPQLGKGDEERGGEMKRISSTIE